jgi:hypothetical protein
MNLNLPSNGFSLSLSVSAVSADVIDVGAVRSGKVVLKEKILIRVARFVKMMNKIFI